MRLIWKRSVVYLCVWKPLACYRHCKKRWMRGINISTTSVEQFTDLCPPFFTIYAFISFFLSEKQKSYILLIPINGGNYLEAIFFWKHSFDLFWIKVSIYFISIYSGKLKDTVIQTGISKYILLVKQRQKLYADLGNAYINTYIFILEDIDIYLYLFFILGHVHACLKREKRDFTHPIKKRKSKTTTNCWDNYSHSPWAIKILNGLW